MKKYFALFLAIGLVLSSCSMPTTPPAAASSTAPEARVVGGIKVRPAIQYQTMDGWGTNLAWWASQVGGWNSSVRNQVMDLIFGSSGLGLNIVRFNIGGGENPTHTHMHEARSMPGYEPSNGVWDWTADANQRWVLLNAKTYSGVDTFEAQSNSPPYWMTNSQCAAGATVATDDNLPSTQYDAFADYLTTVVKKYKDTWGVTFNYIDPVNEPMTNYWAAGGTQEGAHFSVAAQDQVIQKVANSLTAKGLTTKIAASDETSIDTAYTTYNALSSTTQNLITKFNTHSYSGSNRFDLRDLAKSIGKPLAMSEFSTGYVAHNDTAFAPAADLAKGIMKDLKEMGASSWVIWQPMESEKENFFDLDTGTPWTPAGSWGLIHGTYSAFDEPNGTHHNAQTYAISKQYYVMKQFSKYIKKGSIVVDVADPDVLAAVNPSTNQLILVVNNLTGSSTSKTFDLSAFTAVGSTAQRYRTSDTEATTALSSLTVSGGGFSDTIPANSVTTYVISSATYSIPSVSFSPTAFYGIKNRYSGLSWNVAGNSLLNGAWIVQWNDANVGNSNWKFVDQGNGKYEIVSQSSGLAADDNGWSRLNGTVLDQWAWGNGDNQRYYIQPTGDGYYYITNAYSQKAIHVDNWSTQPGAKLVQWSYNGSANAEWQIILR